MHRVSVAGGCMLLLVTLAVAACERSAEQAPPSGTEVLWDRWGVPHIFASQPRDLFFAFGWAQARSHGDLLLRLVGQARGRAAEYWGTEHLESDEWVWTVGIPGRAERWYAEQGDELRGYLDAFVAGINAYAEAHPEALDRQVRPVLPVRGADVLAHTQRVLHFTFVVNPGEIAGARRSFEQAGSNAWAIGPERSASGHPILVANPHLPWADLFTWYEAQLVGPGIDAYGAALVGTPFLGIAFNDRLGWTHTVNTHDGYDLFELQLVEGGYRLDGEVRAFEVDSRVLKVRQEDGSVTDRQLEIRRSEHGPVVADQGETALALRVVGLDDSDLFAQYWEMARARSLAEFEAAIRRMQMPMFTFMYADRDGHILHHFGGRTPRRSRGDWATWQRPVPGNASEWLWQDTHSYDELPTVRDPASGWLQNANDPPWTTTFPRALDPGDFPLYMAPRFMHFRAQRSARMLAEDDSISFEEAIRYKLSTRMELADRLLDDLATAVADHGDEAARRGLRILETWDRTADAGSRGGVLFARLDEKLRDAEVGFAIPWDPASARTTPDGLADPAAAAALLAEATAEIEQRHGSADVAWGDVYRLRRGGHDLPANGGPGALGIFRVVGYRPDGDRHAAAGGDSFVAVVEFSDPPRARVLLSYGNSSQPESPHNGDQLELFSRKELRPAWRTREEIERHLEERESLAALRPRDAPAAVGLDTGRTTTGG